MQKEAEFLKVATKGESKLTVTYDEDLTRDLPSQLEETKIEYLNDGELAEKYLNTPKNQRGEGIPVIKIFPLSDKDGKLFFAYANYFFSYSEEGGFFSRKKLNYRWALGGGCRAEISFDNITRKFTVKNAEIWGI